MTAIINGSSPSVTFSDGTTQATAGLISSSTLNASNVTTGTLPSAQLPAGSVLQVVNATYSSGTSTTSGSFVQSGLYGTITPKFATSKIFVLATSSSTYVQTSGSGILMRMYRGTSGAGSGSNIGASSYYFQTNSASSYTTATISLLDSPASTSALTYTVMMSVNGSGAVGFCYGFEPNNLASITLMEIAA